MTKLLALIAFTLLASTSAHAEKILMIGDSISCRSFGKQMVINLSESGRNDVTLYCTPSSAPDNWLNGTNPPGQSCSVMTSAKVVYEPCGGNGRTPTMSSILAKHKGERMIVALGTNSLGDQRAPHSYRVMAEEVQAASSRCQWIGPPHVYANETNKPKHRVFKQATIAQEETNHANFVQSLGSSVGSLCPVIDSGPYTRNHIRGYTTDDGVHPSVGPGEDWANHIMSEVNGRAHSGGIVVPQTAE